MRLFINIIISSLLLTLTALLIGEGSPSQDFPASSSLNNISYGWVYASQLSNLSPARDHTPYDLLHQRRLEDAASGFYRELAQHPDSLAAYVGLMQSQPTLWAAEIKRLQTKTASQRASHQAPQPADLFKLGTLLYYQRERGSNPPGQPWRDKQEIEAQALMAQAWNNNHAPVIGLMLIEMLVTAGGPSTPAANGLTPVAINKQLVQELAGPQVYSQYLRAEKPVWGTQPPAVSQVPRQNLRPLVAVLASLRSLYGQRSGVLRVVNGKPKMIENPVPASQLAHERYLEEWYNRLVAAIPRA